MTAAQGGKVRQGVQVENVNNCSNKEETWSQLELWYLIHVKRK